MGTVKDIDAVTKEWRQGDFILDLPLPFVFITDAYNPLSDLAKEAAERHSLEKSGFLPIPVSDKSIEGFMVLTQTCDIVRGADERPYIDIAPIVLIDESDIAIIRAAKVPRFFTTEALASQLKAVDLDKVMTVEKSMLKNITCQSGCRENNELELLQRALARKHSRFAFPNEFVESIKNIRGRILEKHKKDSDEGRFLREVQEIRVSPTPNWASSAISLTLYFVFGDHSKLDASFHERASSLSARFTPTGKYISCEIILIPISMMSAGVYLSSPQLDLDYLSS